MIVTILSYVELYLMIVKGRKWFGHTLPKELVYFDIVEPYPRESLGPFLNKMFNFPLRKPVKSDQVAAASTE